MKNFTCQCGNTLYFFNSRCLSCERPLGFLSDQQILSACEIQADGSWLALQSQKYYRPCENYSVKNVCNWLLPVQSKKSFCLSCELTNTIPDLTKPQNTKLWYLMEQSKRRLLYTLIKLRLPIESKKDNPEKGIAFQFLEDVEHDQFDHELTMKQQVLTGHSNGVITINLKEAEDSARIEIREKMNERYRTLIGHFRHESGHYYWDRLVKDGDYLDGFRALFGDERQDYGESLNYYYEHGPAPDWPERCISAYASMHPWEDWAETWAHYLHMMDTLETANFYQTSLMGSVLDNPLQADIALTAAYAQQRFDKLLDDWEHLTKVLNALNRSMGIDDAYPFLIPEPAREKLHFIHVLIHRVN